MSYTCRVCGVITAALHHRCPQCGGIGTMRLDEEMGVVDWKAQEREKAIQAMAQRIYEATAALYISDLPYSKNLNDIYIQSWSVARQFYTWLDEAQDDTRGTASIKH